MRYFNVDIVTAFPEQPKRFVTLASTHCASGLISDLVNCGVRPQSLQQLLHTKRLTNTYAHGRNVTCEVISNFGAAWRGDCKLNRKMLKAMIVMG